MKRTLTLVLAAGAGLACIPWLGLPAFYESFLYLVFHWMILALSWNILSGYSGYFSFGHGAFFGIGMYTTAVLGAKFDWPFLATLPFAALVPALFGLGLGFVVFRVKSVRGELFALLTLAVTFVVATIIVNTPIDGGPGIYLNTVQVPKIAPSPASALYLMVLIAAIVTLLVAWKVQNSKLGIGLFAIHDDEDVAEVMGVPTFRYKLLAFALSCGLAGVAGGIHALFVQYVTTAETFNITVPLTVVLMSVLGGTRWWGGPAIGAAAITGLLYAFTAGDHAVAGRAAVGGILVVVILFMPEGVLGTLLKKRRKPVAKEVLPGPTPAPPPRAPAVVTSRPLLEVRGLSKAFKGVQALDKVNLQVRQGEILGLLGPNGSGKSTFINVVSGHYPLSAGELVFDGQVLTGAPAHRMAQAGIARTYQIPRPFKHMTVLENVSMVAMFGCASLDAQAATREAWKWLEFTGLQDRANALPDDLNLHQRKFLELARALAARPRLVLLDEVLSGLTPGEINEAIELIRRIRDQGATIVFVEHVMRAVMALTDRIVVLNHGKLIAQGQATEVMQDSEVVSAYLGRPAHA
ncbi:branched-chain amino acid ABC transporter ATP-binding protein/permease [Ramlibacter sp. G-1-2-2]|uniref:Branched-chain amino acid ABC transporter ATP-binding protein/permease n=1 Tax=Ramlibacter agri TaxID=2728837 RepID=A0A848H0G8_9BURK|nr:branched-chain amino acid ABC transporter ATP-binding protein/permease [Ramlibacter agri]NML43121.1 branched-chain amino acid ABC transporter ATP-binding protein/permease [Ramlibacter agri]